MPARKRATADRDPPRHEIRIRGPISATTMDVFPTLAASRSGQDTLLIGSPPDQCPLYGVIHQLEALGLQLIEVRRPPSSDPRRPARSRDPGEDDSSRLA